MSMKHIYAIPLPPPSDCRLPSPETTPEPKKSHVIMEKELLSSPGLTSTGKPLGAIRRARSPPRNEHGMMYCDHINCSGKNQTFRRVCEWNKHMDRHERPYKCRESGCELNLGFTYSGGLLRHQREVHKMHLSTKQPLFCPFPNCNRSSGTGFTRRENLEEHKRRRHLEELSEEQSDPGNTHLPALTATTSGEPYAKRRRISSPTETPVLHHSNDGANKLSHLGAVENQLVAHLRAQLLHKDEIIRQQQAELQQLQRILQNLPPQVYGVMHSQMPGSGVS